MRGWLSSRIPEDHRLRTWYRRLRRIREFVYSRVDYELFTLPPPREGMTAPEALLAPGERIVPVTREIAASSLAARAVEARWKRFLYNAPVRGDRLDGVVDAEGMLRGWWGTSFRTRIGVRGGIGTNPGGMGYIYNTRVDPRHRGRGLGWALDLAQIAAGAGRSYCLVRSNNRPALRNWAKCGLTPAARIRCRRCFSRRWRHHFIPLVPDWKALSPDSAAEPGQLILRGRPVEWRLGEFRVTSSG